MFARLSLGAKVSLALGVLALVTVLTGVVATTGMARTRATVESITGDRLPSIQLLHEMGEGQAKALASERSLTNPMVMSSVAQRDKVFAQIEECLGSIEKARQAFAETPAHPKGWDDYQSRLQSWQALYKQVVEICRAEAQLIDSGVRATDPRLKAYQTRALSAAGAAEAAYQGAASALKIVIDAESSEAARETVLADTFDQRGHVLVWAIVVLGVLICIGIAGMFAAGVRKTLTSLLTETEKLARAAQEGRIDVRGDAESVNFEFRPVIESFNKVLDAMSSPLHEAREVLTRIGLNDYTERMSGGHNGVFAELATAINGALDRLLSVQDVFERLARGNMDRLPEFLAIGRRSENDRMMPSAIAMMQAVERVVETAQTACATVARGDLSYHIDESQFLGAYRELAVGINQLVASVQAPMSEMLHVCGRHTLNDISARVNGEYQGVWGEMSNGLNTMGLRSTHIKDTLTAISNGDISELDEIVRKGTRCEEDQLTPAFIRMMEALKALVDDANMLSSAATSGDFDRRADVTKHRGEFAKVVEGVNATLDTVVDKMVWFEGICDAIPFPISVTDLDMNWTFVNKPVEQMLKMNRADLTGKQCYNWGAGICKTEKCGIAGLRRGDLKTTFDQFGMNFQVDTSYLLNRNGERIGHIEVVQDITAAAKVSQFQSAEVAKLESRLQKLSEGDLQFDVDVAEADQYTAEVRENFLRINRSLAQCRSAVQALTSDANTLIDAAVNGRLSTRADASKHQGEYRKIVQGVNDTLDAVIGPLNVAAQFIQHVASGEQMQRITEEYKGDFGLIRNDINASLEVLDRLMGEVRILEKAAMQGRLETRGDAAAFGGLWLEIIGAINTTLDGVTAPIGEAAGVLDRLAGKDLTARMEGDYQGDYAAIKESLNTAMEALEGAVIQTTDASSKVLASAQSVASSAQQIGSSSRQISATIDQVASGSTEQSRVSVTASNSMDQLSRAIGEISMGAQSQAKTVEDTVALIQQISSAIDSVTHIAQDAATKSLEVADVAQSGGESVSQSIEGMAKIKATTDNVAEAIMQLGENSRQIGMIVETIDDIAEQTNLLALNAAIEAARAGEHGKGFAVVADEVRKLAERSSKATKEIADLIGKIRAMTDNAVEAMRSGASEVQSGSELASKAGMALTKIQEAVNQIVHRIEDVSAATEEMNASSSEVVRGVETLSSITEQSAAAIQEMAASSSEVSRSIEQVATVSEENAASAEEVSSSAQEQSASVGEMVSSAEEMAGIAENLQTLVSQFTTSDDAEIPAKPVRMKGTQARRAA